MSGDDPVEPANAVVERGREHGDLDPDEGSERVRGEEGCEQCPWVEVSKLDEGYVDRMEGEKVEEVGDEGGADRVVGSDEFRFERVDDESLLSGWESDSGGEVE